MKKTLGSRFLIASLICLLAVSATACSSIPSDVVGDKEESSGGEVLDKQHESIAERILEAAQESAAEEESESSKPASLSVDEAIAIYNTWLDNHEDISSHTLHKQYYQTFNWFGEQYYWFGADDASRYWYNILVHMETGELLFMMKSDGEYSATSIELLDDWYGNT